MITELRTQINTVLLTVSGLSSSNVFSQEANQNNAEIENTTLPYVVFSELINSPYRITTNTNGFEIPVQLDIFGEKYSLIALEALYSLIRTKILVPTNYNFTNYAIMDITEDFCTPVIQDDVEQLTSQIFYKLEVL